MKQEILILNAMRSEKKGYCSIEFIFYDKNALQSTKNFKGYKPIMLFYNDMSILEKITDKMLLAPVIAEFEERRDAFNPLSRKLFIKALKTNDATVNLL